MGPLNLNLDSVASGINPTILIVLIATLILYIFFSLLFLIGKVILAEAKSLATAINMIKGFTKIGKIKWKNYIIWLILFVFISGFLTGLSGNIAFIQFIGIIIVALIVNPYVEIFSARSLGLIYYY